MYGQQQGALCVVHLCVCFDVACTASMTLPCIAAFGMAATKAHTRLNSSDAVITLPGNPCGDAASMQAPPPHILQMGIAALHRLATQKPRGSELAVAQPSNWSTQTIYCDLRTTQRAGDQLRAHAIKGVVLLLMGTWKRRVNA